MRSKKIGVAMDIALFFFMLLIIGTVLFVAGNPENYFLNVIYLLITFLLVIITYFTNIVTGLIFNMLFIFGQLIYLLYAYLYQDSFTYWSILWLVLPSLYSVTIYFVTVAIRNLETANLNLKKEKVFNSLDADTQLRTLNLFDDDFRALKQLPARYDLPLSMLIIRVRHWDSMKSMISADQAREIVKLVTTILEEPHTQESFKYIIDHNTPTWGVVCFSKSSDVKTLRAQVKEQFGETVRQHVELSTLNLELVTGVTSYDESEMQTSTDFLADGIRELQYDV